MAGDMRRLWIFVIVVSGCTGMTLGENVPGGDTWVEPERPMDGEHLMGALAVERDGDRVWAIHAEARGVERRDTLAAIDPATGKVSQVMNVGGTTDRRVVFPADDRMLLMAQDNGMEHLILFDTDALEPIASRLASTWYWGTRTSPSGNLLVVADNADPAAPIHVIETATLDARAIEHGGDAIEAMWNHHDDRLLVVSVTSPWTPDASARLLRYDLSAASIADGLPEPELAIELSGYDWDLWFSFTWIGVSPDDRWAVFPLRRDGKPALVILDQQAGTTQTISGLGPVGFTADSRTIVSYGYSAEGEAELRLIDPASHAVTVAPLGFDALLSFYVTREGNHVIATSTLPPTSAASFAPTQAVHYDVDSEQVTELADWFDLTDLVTRPGTSQVWLESQGALCRVDLSTREMAWLDGYNEFESIGIRIPADQIVAGHREAVVTRIALETGLIDGDLIALPSAFDRRARYQLPASARRIGPPVDRPAQSAFDPMFARVRAPAPGAVAR